MKLLIVDDDEITRISLDRILQLPGVQVVQAEDGQAAWQMLEDGLRPVLCCSDVVMPNLDGLGLMARAREHPVHRHIPFVLISTSADRQTVQSAIARGVAGYILKPFVAGQARNTVERAFRARRSARAEEAAANRRRLEVDIGRQRALLVSFEGDARQVASDMHAGLSQGLPARVQRLAGAAQMLGLWQACALLTEALQPSTSPAHRILLVEEAHRLAADQRGELRKPAGSEWLAGASLVS